MSNHIKLCNAIVVPRVQYLAKSLVAISSKISYERNVVQHKIGATFETVRR